MLKNIHGLLLFVVALTCAASVPALAQHPRETLHDRAKKSGGNLVWKYRSNRSVVYPNIEELAKRSDIIVVGRALGHRSSLRPDGKFITEDFLVRAQEVIKGDVPLGRSLTVSLPGGSYRFPDGAHVHVMPANYRQAEDGGIYIFFLKKKKGAAYKGYRLVSETQALYAVRDGQVEPANLVKSDPVVVKYQGMGAGEFLAQIHKAVPIKKGKKQ
jgi:hypothetical protein